MNENNNLAFLYNLAKNKLFFVYRSLTGLGTKKTLKILKNIESNLRIITIPSGKKVFDWVVPPEWNINKAYVLDKKITK